MKLTVERAKQLSDLPQNFTFPKKPSRLKTKSSATGVRLKRISGAPSSKRSSRPETPLLKWKSVETNGDNNYSEEEEKLCGEGDRKNRRKSMAKVSARKLGAGAWKLHSPEFQIGGGQKLGHQLGGGNVGARIHGHRIESMHNPPVMNDPVHHPHSGSCPTNGVLYKFDSSFQFSNSAMEGATKWDPVDWEARNESKQILRQKKLLDKQASAATVISALETELEEARARINELESERRSSKKKLEQFLRKFSEERAAWRNREHEKIRAIIDDMKVDLNREKKNRQRLEIVNSKLVNELAEAKVSAKRHVHEYGKERKARELIEEVCDELAKEIGEDKAEVEALKRESMKLQEEVDEERKMLQMAEVWREERVQMKLIDAKVMLEEKFSQLNNLVQELDSFCNSSSKTSDIEEIKKAEFLRQMAASINIQDVRDLNYQPPNPDDIFSVFEDMNFRESNEKEVEPYSEYSPASHASKIHIVSPEIKMPNKNSALRHSDVYMNQSEDASEWETVSHIDDQGSSFSLDGSDNPSMHQNFRVTSVSRTGSEWERSGGEETPVVEITEVGSRKMRQLKKVSSISKLWKPSNGDNYKMVSVDGMKGRLSNGRLSNGVSTAGDLSEQWSSPDLGNPQLNRGMKGCIEWPLGAHKSSLKSQLLEARMENQKVQLRQVLKHKI